MKCHALGRGLAAPILPRATNSCDEAGRNSFASVLHVTVLVRR
jgi:hypothetical protein